MSGRPLLLALVACAPQAMTEEELGRTLFEDKNLSAPPGQSCADCHDPALAFREPESDHTTSSGVVAGRFGPRNTPTVLYAASIPPLHRDPDRGWVGGLFLDGRADTLEAQAAGPLLNPIEMNNPDRAAVAATLRAAKYAGDFRVVFGPGSLDDDDAAFEHAIHAIATYERSPALAPFASKYDRYVAGRAALTDAEQRGLAIFLDPQRGNCASCHPPPLFTDFSYANLGIPIYRNSAFFTNDPAFNPDGDRYIDYGLGAIVKDANEDGKFRVPTLRNVMRTAPFGHNGYFENVPYMIDFLATRDTGSPYGTWAAPEIPATIDRRVGSLPLSASDRGDLRAFLATLTDDH